MKKEYITDYKNFISDWRERYIEVLKDIRRGKNDYAILKDDD